MTDVVGVWDWEYADGHFDVEFRSGGTFHCEQYQEHSHWEQKGDTVTIDWGQFGNYTMTVSGGEMSGCYTGHKDDWRKAKKTREFSAEERAQHEKDAHSHSHAHAHAHDHSHEGGGCCSAPAPAEPAEKKGG